MDMKFLNSVLDHESAKESNEKAPQEKVLPLLKGRVPRWSLLREKIMRLELLVRN